MPMIYGKTMNSTISDLKVALENYILFKESGILASLIYKFWREKYPKPQIIMNLIPLLAKFVSFNDRPVYYSTPYFTTSQDYRKLSKNSVYYYDKKAKKRRSVTLTFSTDKRDKRKTQSSTFVNFIHQKDAYIAMNMILTMMDKNLPILFMITSLQILCVVSRYQPTTYKSLKIWVHHLDQSTNSFIIT